MTLDGFLSSRIQSKKIKFHEILLLVVFGVGLVVSFAVFPLYVVLVGFGVLLVFFMFRLDIGIYLLCLFGLMHGWEIVIGTYPWARDLPYGIPSINAPIADMLAIILLMSIVGAIALKTYHIQSFGHLKRLLPGFVLYFFFVGIACVAAFGAFENEILASLKYIARPYVFVMLAFVLLPVLIIRDTRQLSVILKLWFWFGVGASIFGLISLIHIEQSGWLRVMPYSIFGIAPFGYNHNQLAEVLAMLIPVGIFFSVKNFGKSVALVYIVGTVCIVAASLLTLSRAAWLVFVVQIGFYIFWYGRNTLRQIYKIFIMPIIIVGLIAVTWYMVVFLNSSVVQSSNSARWETLKITSYYVAKSPLFGYGPGMYVPLFNDIFLYSVEFGDALDAHGFIQKISLETGLFGLGVWSLFFAWVVWLLWREQQSNVQYRFLLQSMLILIVSAIVFQLFNTSYLNSVMWLPIGIGLASATVIKGNGSNSLAI